MPDSRPGSSNSGRWSVVSSNHGCNNIGACAYSSSNSRAINIPEVQKSSCQRCQFSVKCGLRWREAGACCPLPRCFIGGVRSLHRHAFAATRGVRTLSVAREPSSCPSVWLGFLQLFTSAGCGFLALELLQVVVVLHMNCGKIEGWQSSGGGISRHVHS